MVQLVVHRDFDILLAPASKLGLPIERQAYPPDPHTSCNPMRGVQVWIRRILGVGSGVSSRAGRIAAELEEGGNDSVTPLVQHTWEPRQCGNDRCVASSCRRARTRRYLPGRACDLHSSTAEAVRPPCQHGELFPKP